jgi:hypothetical protein
MRLLLALLALCALLAPPADAKTKKRHCPTRGRTLAADSRARVWEVRRGDELSLYACLRRTGRVRRLTYGDIDYSSVRLAAPYVAYDDVEDGSGGVFEFIERVDLRTGREKQVAELGTLFGEGSQLGDLVVARSGAVAWTAVKDENGTSVEKYDADGAGTLDPGPDVDPGSLALTASGKRVYWTRGGVPQSAPLR